jgi:hypothetical protein
MVNVSSKANTGEASARMAIADKTISLRIVLTSFSR